MNMLFGIQCTSHIFFLHNKVLLIDSKKKFLVILELYICQITKKFFGLKIMQ